MAASIEDDGLAAEDYYAVLNLPRSASLEDINGAFRRLSKIFHPDKHVDPKKKKHAELMFTKIKKAHEVLTDTNKRVIYDRCGAKGLEIEGMEVITRTKSAAEIIAELDRLQQEQEDRKLHQMTNPRGTVSVGINATDMFDRYDEEYSSGIGGVEVGSMALTQSVECPLTRKDTVRLVGSLSSQNGNGSGMFTTVWRRLWSSKGWNEFELSVGNGMACGLRAFYQINRRCFCVGTVSAAFANGGFRPGLSTILTFQLDRNLQGRLIFNGGLSSSMTTMLIYDNQLYNFTASFQLGIPLSFIKTSLSRSFTSHNAKVRVAAKFGTTGLYFEYGVEKKITQFSWLGATMVLGVPYGVMLRIKLLRGQQTFIFPIKLSEEVMPDVVFYGTFIPSIVYFTIRKLIVTPYLKEQEEEDLEKKKKDNADTLANQRQEAEAAIDLMLETVDRIIEAEEKRNGLIITKAVYGRLLSEGDLSEDECINVTIPVQVLVKDSQLQLPDSKTKADIPGFYDPCPGVSKSLYIQYRFRNQQHEATIEDDEPIRLPLQSHLIRQNSVV